MTKEQPSAFPPPPTTPIPHLIPRRAGSLGISSSFSCALALLWQTGPSQATESRGALRCLEVKGSEPLILPQPLLGLR